MACAGSARSVRFTAEGVGDHHHAQLCALHFKEEVMHDGSPADGPQPWPASMPLACNMLPLDGCSLSPHLSTTRQAHSHISDVICIICTVSCPPSDQHVCPPPPCKLHAGTRLQISVLLRSHMLTIAACLPERIHCNRRIAGLPPDVCSQSPLLTLKV